MTRPLNGGLPSVPARRQSGFTLIEVLVTLVVLAEVVIGILLLFDATNRISRAQTYLAEMQTSQRVTQHELVRFVRMTGRGGVPSTIPPANAGASTSGVLPTGLAVAVINNVAPGTHIGDGSSPEVVAGTDVLILRGVFSTPIYTAFGPGPNDARPQMDVGDGQMTFLIEASLPGAMGGVVQDIDPLRDALQDSSGALTQGPEAFIVRDLYKPGAIAVLELDPNTTNLGSMGASSLTLGLHLLGAQNESAYGRITQGTVLKQGAGGTLVTLTDGTQVQLPKRAASVGLLEEYRFYVRQEYEIAGDPNSRLTPVLTRARFYPNTDNEYPSGAVDLADNVVDLQVAMGFDLTQPVPGRPDLPPRPDGTVNEIGAAPGDDEVLYNFPGDPDGLGNIATSPWANPDARLVFLRLSTVVQADRPDPEAPDVFLGRIEDHDHQNPTPSPFNATPVALKLRKRLLQTVVELRNVS